MRDRCSGSIPTPVSMTSTLSHWPSSEGLGPDGQSAPVQHGLDGVDEEVQKYLLQTFTVPMKGREARREIFLHLDAGQGKLVAHQFQGIVDYRGDSQRLKFRMLGPGKIQQSFDDFRGPLRLAP